MEILSRCKRTAKMWRYSGFSIAGLLAMLAGPHDAGAVSPRALLEVVDIGPAAISPDGTRVAFRTEQAAIERNTYDSMWFVQDLIDESPAWRVADGGVPLRDSAGVSVPVRAVWSADGRWIYFLASIDGKVDVWRAAADGSGAKPLTLDPADVRDFSLDADERVLHYSVGATRDEVAAAEQDEYNHGIRIHEKVPLGQGLFRSGYIGGRLATQRLGHWFNRVPLLAEVPDRWKSLDLLTGEVRAADKGLLLAAGVDPPELGDTLDVWKHVPESGGDRIAVLARTGERLQGQRDRPGVELVVVDATDLRTPISCVHALCRDRPISSIQWRPATDEVLFTVTDPDLGLAQSIYRWDVSSGVVTEIATSDGLMSGGRDPASACGASQSSLVCVTASANHPPRLERIDIESTDRRVLFDPNEALAHAVVQVAQVRLLRWRDAKGRTFTGQFYPAQGRATDAPLFVTYYTCPGFVRGGLGDEWPLLSLAAHGIAALCINRLPGYTLDAIDRYDEGLAAVESAVDMLVAAGEIDRGKIGMGGLSFGTEVTLWTVMNSDLIAAASISSPLLSRTMYLLGSLKGENFLSGMRRHWQVGPPGEPDEAWRRLAPELALGKINAPLLMQLPEQEYIHTLDYAIPLLRGGRAELYVFPHEAHQKFQPRHKLSVYQRNLDWFRFWLLGVEDADAGKDAQYARWRSMRSIWTNSAASESVPVH